MLKLLTTVSAVMMAAGLALPFIIGSTLSGTAYSVLQLGGLAGLVAFGLPYNRQLRRQKARATESK